MNEPMNENIVDAETRYKKLFDYFELGNFSGLIPAEDVELPSKLLMAQRWDITITVMQNVIKKYGAVGHMFLAFNNHRKDPRCFVPLASTNRNNYHMYLRTVFLVTNVAHYTCMMNVKTTDLKCSEGVVICSVLPNNNWKAIFYEKDGNALKNPKPIGPEINGAFHCLNAYFLKVDSKDDEYYQKVEKKFAKAFNVNHTPWPVKK
jgi:hypothetical protein